MAASGQANKWTDEERVAYIRSLKIIELPRDARLLKFLDHALEQFPEAPDWVGNRDQKGRLFFWNKSTRNTSWHHPLVEVIKELASVVRGFLLLSDKELDTEVREQHAAWSKVGSALISDWAVAKDEASGQNYYYNTETGETRWENPVEEALLPFRAKLGAIQKLLDRKYLATLGPVAPTEVDNADAAPLDSAGRSEGLVDAIFSEAPSSSPSDSTTGTTRSKETREERHRRHKAEREAKKSRKSSKGSVEEPIVASNSVVDADDRPPSPGFGSAVTVTKNVAKALVTSPEAASTRSLLATEAAAAAALAAASVPPSSAAARQQGVVDKLASVPVSSAAEREPAIVLKSSRPASFSASSAVAEQPAPVDTTPQLAAAGGQVEKPQTAAFQAASPPAANSAEAAWQSDRRRLQDELAEVRQSLLEREQRAAVAERERDVLKELAQAQKSWEGEKRELLEEMKHFMETSRALCAAQPVQPSAPASAVPAQCVTQSAEWEAQMKHLQETLTQDNRAAMRSALQEQIGAVCDVVRASQSEVVDLFAQLKSTKKSDDKVAAKAAEALKTRIGEELHESLLAQQAAFKKQVEEALRATDEQAAKREAEKLRGLDLQTEIRDVVEQQRVEATKANKDAAALVQKQVADAIAPLTAHVKELEKQRAEDLRRALVADEVANAARAKLEAEQKTDRQEMFTNQQASTQALRRTEERFTSQIAATVALLEKEAKEAERARREGIRVVEENARAAEQAAKVRMEAAAAEHRMLLKQEVDQRSRDQNNARFRIDEATEQNRRAQAEKNRLDEELQRRRLEDKKRDEEELRQRLAWEAETRDLRWKAEQQDMEWKAKVKQLEWQAEFTATQHVEATAALQAATTTQQQRRPSSGISRSHRRVLEACEAAAENAAALKEKEDSARRRASRSERRSSGIVKSEKNSLRSALAMDLAPDEGYAEYKRRARPDSGSGGLERHFRPFSAAALAASAVSDSGGGGATGSDDDTFRGLRDPPPSSPEWSSDKGADAFPNRPDSCYYAGDLNGRVAKRPPRRCGLPPSRSTATLPVEEHSSKWHDIHDARGRADRLRLHGSQSQGGLPTATHGSQVSPIYGDGGQPLVRPSSGSREHVMSSPTLLRSPAQLSKRASPMSSPAALRGTAAPPRPASACRALHDVCRAYPEVLNILSLNYVTSH